MNQIDERIRCVIMPEVRLQKLIARFGYASRRSAETLIMEGRVRVNGQTVTGLGVKVPVEAAVEIDGRLINRNIPRVYIVMNKPAGYVCSKKDPEGRKVVYELLAKETRRAGVNTVGRLDCMSEGLLILTNDGGFAHRIGHPSGGIVKKYEVTTEEPIPYNLVDAWKKGVYINGTRYGIDDYSRLTERRLIVSLREGKNREIRRLFSSIRVEVVTLKRIAIGSLRLGDLPTGRYRELSPGEIHELLPDYRTRAD
jgi:23S rRNA pseudouridine2605 synthase